MSCGWRSQTCTLCGQCLTHCPVGALIERDDTERSGTLWTIRRRTVVGQIAPSVRAAWGEDLGLKPEFATVKTAGGSPAPGGIRLYIDTDFSADLTIMEEASEFLEQLKNKDHEKFPMFTSCCPGWVRFCEGYFLICRSGLHREIPSADVRSHRQELLRHRF